MFCNFNEFIEGLWFSWQLPKKFRSSNAPERKQNVMNFHSTILHMIFLLSMRRQISWSLWPRVEDWKKILSYAVCFGLLTQYFFSILNSWSNHSYFWNWKGFYVYFLWLLSKRNDCWTDVLMTFFLFWNMSNKTGRCHTIVPLSELDSFSPKFFGTWKQQRTAFAGHFLLGNTESFKQVNVSVIEVIKNALIFTFYTKFICSLSVSQVNVKCLLRFACFCLQDRRKK